MTILAFSENHWVKASIFDKNNFLQAKIPEQSFEKETANGTQIGFLSWHYL